jgi:hypothetical protein
MRGNIHTMPILEKKSDSVKKAWELLVLVLSILVLTAVITGVMGRAFYVTRDEFNKTIDAIKADVTILKGKN